MTLALASRRMASPSASCGQVPGTGGDDGPPLLAGTAGAAFAAFAGQVVLVVAAGQTSEEAIDASLRRRGEREKACFVLNGGRSPATRLVAAFARASA